jgi:NADH:ubiquinone oxidoreductase subunit D
MRCSRSLSGAFLGLLNNRILKSRLASVGMFSASKLNNYSISGIMARGAGLRRDLRLRRCGFYGAYWYLSFRSFMGRRGDNLDRFIIRIKEVLESFRIISQVLGTLMLFVQKPNTEIAEFSITPLNMQKTPKAPASAIKNKQTQLSSYS